MFLGKLKIIYQHTSGDISTKFKETRGIRKWLLDGYRHVSLIMERG